MHDDTAPAPGELRMPPPTDTPRKFSSRELFADGAREIVIEHNDRLYRMRITQNGKLILTA